MAGTAGACIDLLKYFNIEVNHFNDNYEFNYLGSHSYDKLNFVNYVMKNFVNKILDANK